MFKNTSYVLPNDKKLLESIKRIEPDLVEVVRSRLSGAWTSVAFHMRAPSIDPCAPRRPPVLVASRERTVCDFDPVESELLELFKRVDLELYVGSFSKLSLNVPRGIRKYALISLRAVGPERVTLKAVRAALGALAYPKVHRVGGRRCYGE